MHQFETLCIGQGKVRHFCSTGNFAVCYHKSAAKKPIAVVVPIFFSTDSAKSALCGEKNLEPRQQ